MPQSDSHKYDGRVARWDDKYGIFPLEIVVFPGSYVPLYIFEERYKQLINDCITEDKPFGINYTPGKRVHDYGCLVKVSEVVKMHDKGEMNIIVVGLERCLLKQMVDGTNKEYMVGHYEGYGQEDKDFDENLLSEVLELYNRIVTSVENPIMQAFEFDDLKRLIHPSYVIAQRAGVSIQERQDILALAFENDRLEVLQKHLKGILPLATKTEMIQKVIKNNGYIGPHTFGI